MNAHSESVYPEGYKNSSSDRLACSARLILGNSLISPLCIHFACQPQPLLSTHHETVKHPRVAIILAR